MINHLESHSTSGHTLAQQDGAHRISYRAATLAHPLHRLAQAYQPDAVQPEYSSLWDLNLLDRLTTPLTRYHE
jgi:hypothetical protein